MTDAAPPPPAKRFAREITSFVALVPLVWIVGWAPLVVFDITIALVAALALHEFLQFGRRKGYEIPIWLCIAIMFVIVGAFVIEELSVEVGMFVALLGIPAWYVLRGKDIEQSLPASATAVLSTMYIGMLGGSMVRLHDDFPEGPKLIFFLLLVVWLGDAGAYYTGKNFGKRKLSPLISPKKTVEGLMGGITMSVITAVVIQLTFFREIRLAHAIVVGIVLSVSGVIGDLAESMWKRSAAVKDSGTLIPGHGGFFDRFDSIFFTAPILYIYWAFTHKGATTLNIITG